MNERNTEEATDDQEHQPADSEDDRGMFADLLDRVEAGRTNRVAHRFRAEAEDARTDTDPIEAAQEVLAGTIAPVIDATEFDASEDGSIRRRAGYLALGLAMIGAFLVPTIVTATPISTTGSFPGPSSAFADSRQILSIESADAAYLNRVYGETTHEVAYCGSLNYDDGHWKMEVWMADTIHSSPTEIGFSTGNCPERSRQVLLHTHPSGNLQLSGTDKGVLEAGPENIMCVQGGTLETEPGAELENLACYRIVDTNDGEPKLGRLRLVVQPKTIGSP